MLQPQRQGRAHPPHDARGRFPRTLSAGVWPTSPAWCSTNIFIVIPPTNTPSSASKNWMRCSRRRGPEIAPLPETVRGHPGSLCPLSRPPFARYRQRRRGATTLRSERAFRAGGGGAVAALVRSNAARSSSWSIITSRSSNMAQQRNIDDPATVIEFANIVKSQANLDALILLTLADGQGTTRYLVGLEGVARLAALPRDRALSARSGRISRAEQNRARRTARRRRGRSSRPISRTRSKPISITCRTIISATFGVEEIVAHLESFSHALAQHLPARRAGLRPRAALGSAAGTGSQRRLDLHLGSATVARQHRRARSPSRPSIS